MAPSESIRILIKMDFRDRRFGDMDDLDGLDIDLTAQITREDEGGYGLYCPELDIYARGADTLDVIEKFKEALETHFENTEPRKLH